jgi:hypothetical protein
MMSHGTTVCLVVCITCTWSCPDLPALYQAKVAVDLSFALHTCVARCQVTIGDEIVGPEGQISIPGTCLRVCSPLNEIDARLFSDAD